MWMSKFINKSVVKKKLIYFKCKESITQLTTKQLLNLISFHSKYFINSKDSKDSKDSKNKKIQKNTKKYKKIQKNTKKYKKIQKNTKKYKHIQDGFFQHGIFGRFHFSGSKEHDAGVSCPSRHGIHRSDSLG